MFLFNLFKRTPRMSPNGEIPWEDLLVDGKEDCDRILSGKDCDVDSRVLIFTKSEQFFIVYKHTLALDSTFWLLPNPEEFCTSAPPANVTNVLMWESDHHYNYRIGTPSVDMCDGWVYLPYSQILLSYSDVALPA